MKKNENLAFHTDVIDFGGGSINEKSWKYQKFDFKNMFFFGSENNIFGRAGPKKTSKNKFLDILTILIYIYWPQKIHFWWW